MSRRFFFAPQLPSSGTYTIGQEDAPEELHHLTRVLRLGAGEEILLVNGLGCETKARILSADKLSMSLEILSQTASPRQKPGILVCQAALKGAKMDWLIEKLTELGAAELQLLLTEFSVRQEENSRLDRWERIVRSAVKQSENPQLLKLRTPKRLEELFAENKWQNNPKILLHPEEKSPLLLQALEEICKKNTAREDILLFLGPEGGFSPAEVNFLEDQGVYRCSLGKTILRGETAGIVAASTALQAIAFWAH